MHGTINIIFVDPIFARLPYILIFFSITVSKKMMKLVAVRKLFIAFCALNLFVPFFPVLYEVPDVTQTLLSHSTVRA